MSNTFRSLDSQIGSIPGTLARALAHVDESKGKAEAFRLQHPEQLKALIDVARIQSTEASNEIEGITAPPARIAALVAEKTTPANRSEEEIAGYRAVLDLIHSSASSIPLRNNVLFQLHRDMYQFTPVRAGRFKPADNTVEEVLPDGSKRDRFRPVPAFLTPQTMDELNNRFSEELAKETHHPLLLIGAYIFDFSVIHPFSDGNGRMSRLLTLLLLYQSGYDVGRYISLEKLISDSKETYYDALEVSTKDWHEEHHTVLPWLQYFVGLLVAAYKKFEENTQAVGGYGSKSRAVEVFVRSVVGDFAMADLRRAAPTASDAAIRKVLHRLRDEGYIESGGTGRNARWRRIKDFD